MDICLLKEMDIFKAKKVNDMFLRHFQPPRIKNFYCIPT